MKPINVEKFQRLLIRKWRKAHDKRVADIRAADSAPAVCEWTPQDEGPAHEIWKTGCGTMYERAKSTGWCNKCKAPIKFTEAK